MEYIEDIDDFLSFHLFGPGKQIGFIESYILQLSSLIGFLFIIKSIISFFSLINRQCLRKQRDLYKSYGGVDSWMVITGGSDGIGFEYCKELAKQGFNICMIGRNKDKMISKLNEIQALYKVKTRFVVADFSTMVSMDDYNKVAE
jgi:17beta-estradiol 17-dehydrogenase / very-long-chain 3-oxoacyl-CoA reductase